MLVQPMLVTRARLTICIYGQGSVQQTSIAGRPGKGGGEAGMSNETGVGFRALWLTDTFVQ